MELVFEDRLPSRARRSNQEKHDLWDYLMTFLESGRTVARVKLEPGEYLSSTTCLAAFTNAIHRYEIDHVVRAVIRNDSVYLIHK